MIYLITGLPGNGKTLYTIKTIDDMSKSEGRPVFYAGIPLTDAGVQALGWVEIDPKRWNECPPRSIVVLDEAQGTFRNRSINTVPPKYVSDLETHRHLGLDLFFLTQMPKLIDPGVRALVQVHRHLVRVFGMEASTVHQWTEVRDDCHKGARRKDSEKTKWVFDKRYYDYYRSAEAHTMKRMIPKRIWVLGAVPLVIFGAIFVVRHLVLSNSASPAPSSSAPLSSAAGASPLATSVKALDPLADARQYLWNQTPRIKDVPYTAPKYDELTKPSSVPVPAACVQMGSRCQCYTQQGTKYEVSYNQCLDITHNGYFEEFARDREGASRSRVRDADPVQADQMPLPDRSEARNVVVLDRDGYGVLGSRHDSASPVSGRS